MASAKSQTETDLDVLASALYTPGSKSPFQRKGKEPDALARMISTHADIVRKHDVSGLDLYSLHPRSILLFHIIYCTWTIHTLLLTTSLCLIHAMPQTQFHYQNMDPAASQKTSVFAADQDRFV